MVELQRVSQEMLPALSELHVRSWQVAYRGMVPDAHLDGMSVERRLARWLERFPSLVSEEYAIVADESVVGFCVLGATRDSGEQVGEIHGFYLHPDAWGKGYAHPAMRLALVRLREAGFMVVTLWVLEPNARARRFYERAGFALDGGRQQLNIGGGEQWEVRYRHSLRED